MTVWTNTRFDGHYPVGVAAVVVADSTERASELLNDDLEKRGLARSAKPDQFVQLGTDQQIVIVLNDGNY